MARQKSPDKLLGPSHDTSTPQSKPSPLVHSTIHKVKKQVDQCINASSPPVNDPSFVRGPNSRVQPRKTRQQRSGNTVSARKMLQSGKKKTLKAGGRIMWAKQCGHWWPARVISAELAGFDRTAPNCNWVTWLGGNKPCAQVKREHMAKFLEHFNEYYHPEHSSTDYKKAVREALDTLQASNVQDAEMQLTRDEIQHEIESMNSPQLEESNPLFQLHEDSALTPPRRSPLRPLVNLAPPPPNGTKPPPKKFGTALEMKRGFVIPLG